MLYHSKNFQDILACLFPGEGRHILQSHRGSGLTSTGISNEGTKISGLPALPYSMQCDTFVSPMSLYPSNIFIETVRRLKGSVQTWPGNTMRTKVVQDMPRNSHLRSTE